MLGVYLEADQYVLCGHERGVALSFLAARGDGYIYSRHIL